MKLTNKNRRELEVLRHYMLAHMKHIPLPDEAIEAYFDWSDRGNRRFLAEASAEINSGVAGPYTALLAGKRLRDLQVTSFRRDWGDLINEHDFVDEPDSVAQFLAKALRKPEILAVRAASVP